MATSTRVLAGLRDWPDREAFVLPKGTISKGPTVRVSAVGMGIGNNSQLLCSALAALSEVKIEPSMWSVTSNSIGFEVSLDQSRKAQRALHAQLIEVDR
jgi:aspartokinase